MLPSSRPRTWPTATSTTGSSRTRRSTSSTRGARLRIRRMTAPPDLRECDERIAHVRREKESAIDAQDFEKAASLRDDEKTLLGQKACLLYTSDAADDLLC